MQPEPGDRTSDGAAAADLSSCDREPIHIPGAIQPHGMLFAVIEANGSLVSVSDNVADHAGVLPADPLGQPVASLFDEASNVRLRAALRQGEFAAGPPGPAALPSRRRRRL